MTKLLVCRDCGCPTFEGRTYCPDCREARIGSLVRHLRSTRTEAPSALRPAMLRLKEAYRLRELDLDQGYWPNCN